MKSARFQKRQANDDRGGKKPLPKTLHQTHRNAVGRRQADMRSQIGKPAFLRAEIDGDEKGRSLNGPQDSLNDKGVQEADGGIQKQQGEMNFQEQNDPGDL